MKTPFSVLGKKGHVGPDVNHLAEKPVAQWRLERTFSETL